MIFDVQVFSPRTYVWIITGNFSYMLSTDATYIVTPDSDVSYLCIAMASDLKSNQIQLFGTIEVSVKGTVATYL